MLVAFDLSLRLPLYYSRRQPLGECRHRGLARRLVAVSRLAVLVWPKASVHSHGSPTGA
jgi:hypothetical protein